MNSQNPEKPSKSFRGVWIPKHIWEAEDLTWHNKCLLAEITCLDDDDGCYASNAYLADKFKTTSASMAETISKLRKAGWIVDVRKSSNGYSERRIAVSRPQSQLIHLQPPLKAVSTAIEGGINGGCRQTDQPYIQERKDKKDSRASLGTSELQAKVDEIYQAYPLKIGSAKAKASILKALRKSEASFILLKTIEFSKLWVGRPLGYCPHPATWFNQERYSDDISLQGPRGPVKQDWDALKERIETHPANYESKKYNPAHTPAQASEYANLREIYGKRFSQQLTLTNE